jgi:hypothetical protein
VLARGACAACIIPGPNSRSRFNGDSFRICSPSKVDLAQDSSHTEGSMGRVSNPSCTPREPTVLDVLYCTVHILLTVAPKAHLT